MTDSQGVSRCLDSLCLLGAYNGATLTKRSLQGAEPSSGVKYQSARSRSSTGSGSTILGTQIAQMNPIHKSHLFSTYIKWMLRTYFCEIHIVSTRSKKLHYKLKSMLRSLNRNQLHSKSPVKFFNCSLSQNNQNKNFCNFNVIKPVTHMVFTKYGHTPNNNK